MSGLLLALSGKGGSGKTTLSAMIIRQLLRSGVQPVLAVDADPNATLALTLGVETGATIADLRDRMGEAAEKVTEIPKERLLDRWLAETLVEESGFDLLTMGRPEGPKCYCYVNGLLRRYLKELRANYAVTVVDCEAGMEYLSRLTLEEVDTLVMVAENTPVGLASARRIAKLADSLPVRVRRRVLAVNKLGPSGALTPNFERPAAEALAWIPYDEDIYRRCAEGRPIDAYAGTTARPAVEELTRLCVPQLYESAGVSR